MYDVLPFKTHKKYNRLLVVNICQRERHEQRAIQVPCKAPIQNANYSYRKTPGNKRF